MSEDQGPAQSDPHLGRRHSGRAVSGRRLLNQIRRRVGRFLHPQSDEEHNEHILYLDMVFQGLMMAGPMSFVAVYLVRLDAPDWLVGLYTSLPALASMLLVLPAGALVQRQKRLIRAVTAPRLAFRALIGLMAVAAWLPASIASYFVVALRTLASAPSSMIMVANTTVLGQATTPRRRPRMLSTRMAINGLVSAGFGYLVGLWLDRVIYPRNYQLLFLVAVVAGIASFFTLERLRLPESSEPAKGRKQVSLRDMLPLIQGTPAFRNYLISALVFKFGQSLPMALYSIYRVRELGCSDYWIGVILTVHRLMSVVTYVVLSRLSTRASFRSKMWISGLGVALFPLAMALAQTPEQLLVSSVLGGTFFPALNIFLTDTLFRVSPEDQRPTFVAANTFVGNVTGFIAPLLGTLVADLTTIRIALIVAAVFRVVGGLAFWRLGVGTGAPSKPAKA